MKFTIEFKKNHLQNIVKIKNNNFNVFEASERKIIIDDIEFIASSSPYYENYLLIRDNKDNYIYIDKDDIEEYNVIKSR